MSETLTVDHRMPFSVGPVEMEKMRSRAELRRLGLPVKGWKQGVCGYCQSGTEGVEHVRSLPNGVKICVECLLSRRKP